MLGHMNLTKGIIDMSILEFKGGPANAMTIQDLGMTVAAGASAGADKLAVPVKQETGYTR